MRTRRSPRNQDRLWKALGGPVATVVQVPQTPCCFDCVCYPKGGRSRGECTLIGEMVNGRSLDRPCFRRREEETP